MIPAAVGYARASSLEHALELLGEPEAKAIAGGQSLLPVLKLRIARPSLLVDIGALELRGINVIGDELRVGALTTWDELARTPALASPALAALPECAGQIGDLQVRNRGTIGGSLAHADPASDIPAVLLALGARLRLVSPAGERTVEVANFLSGPFSTVLGEHELVCEVVIPIPAPGAGSAYASVEHPASGFALAGAAALVRADGSTSVAVTGVGARPELLATGQDLHEAIGALDVYGDAFAPAEYRRHLVEIVALRALDRAAAQAEGSR
jgi:carbon-monoxide dehydrogenase medium subunit